jgi:hypothetical protein
MAYAMANPMLMAQLGKRGYLHSSDGQIPSIAQHTSHVLGLYHRLLNGDTVDGGFATTDFPGLVRAHATSRTVGSHAAAASAAAHDVSPEPLVPLTAPWRITFDTNPDDCNFSCTMCEQHSEFSPHQKERKANKVRRRRMDFETIRNVVTEMAPLGLKEIIPTTMGEAAIMLARFVCSIDARIEHLPTV